MLKFRRALLFNFGYYIEREDFASSLLRVVVVCI